MLDIRNLCTLISNFQIFINQECLLIIGITKGKLLECKVRINSFNSNDYFCWQIESNISVCVRCAWKNDTPKCNFRTYGHSIFICSIFMDCTTRQISCRLLTTLKSKLRTFLLNIFLEFFNLIIWIFPFYLFIILIIYLLFY